MYENQKSEFILQRAYALLIVLQETKICDQFWCHSLKDVQIRNWSAFLVIFGHTRLMWAQHKTSKERDKEIKVLYLNRLALMHDLQTSIKSLVYT